VATVTRTHDFDAIYRDDGDRLWRTIYAFAGGRRDVADDATAEAFARALEHQAKILDPVPWLYRTAFRVASSELKRHRHIEEPNDLLFVEQRDADLSRSLARLSPMQRASIYLHYIADLPVRDVATLTGTSAAAVKVHLFRGRERLRALLGEEGEQG
jgi:RNA polymerase sigma-70 factor (ECF subfamily)